MARQVWRNIPHLVRIPSRDVSSPHSFPTCTQLTPQRSLQAGAGAALLPRLPSAHQSQGQQFGLAFRRASRPMRRPRQPRPLAHAAAGSRPALLAARRHRAHGHAGAPGPRLRRRTLPFPTSRRRQRPHDDDDDDDDPDPPSSRRPQALPLLHGRRHLLRRAGPVTAGDADRAGAAARGPVQVRLPRRHQPLRFREVPAGRLARASSLARVPGPVVRVRAGCVREGGRARAEGTARCGAVGGGGGGADSYG